MDLIIEKKAQKKKSMKYQKIKDKKSYGYSIYYRIHGSGKF